jgi:hypothetical protein
MRCVSVKMPGSDYLSYSPHKRNEGPKSLRTLVTLKTLK